MLDYNFNQRRIGEWQGRKSAWKRWFAWHPVRLGKHGRTVFLAPVERRFVTVLEADIGPVLLKRIRFEYREINSQEPPHDPR